jgi:hypothetical protein
MGLNLKKSDRQDYFLATGEIVFTTDIIDTEGNVTMKGEDMPPNAIRCNAVVTSNDGRLSSLHLARTQQTLQAQLFRKMGGINGAKVVDVVILGLIHLGKFTNEEFNKAPEGQVIQEKPIAETEVVVNA